MPGVVFRAQKFCNNRRLKEVQFYFPNPLHGNRVDVNFVMYTNSGFWFDYILLYNALYLVLS